MKSKKIIYLYKGMNKFKISWQLRCNLVKAEDDDVHADSHSVLNSLKI
jgi:hypothetical protein